MGTSFPILVKTESQHGHSVYTVDTNYQSHCACVIICIHGVVAWVCLRVCVCVCTMTEGRGALIDTRIQTYETTSSTIVVPVSNAEGFLTVRDVIQKDINCGTLVKIFSALCCEVNEITLNGSSYLRAISQPKNRPPTFVAAKPDPISGGYRVSVKSEKPCRLVLELVPHAEVMNSSKTAEEKKMEMPNLSDFIELRFWFIIDPEVVNHFHATLQQYLSWVRNGHLFEGATMGTRSLDVTLDGSARFTDIESIIEVMTRSAGSDNVPIRCLNVFRAGNPWCVVSNTSTRCMKQSGPEYSNPERYNLTKPQGTGNFERTAMGMRVTFPVGSFAFEVPAQLITPEALMTYRCVFGIDVDVDGWDLMQYLWIVASQCRPDLCAKIDAATLREVLDVYFMYQRQLDTKFTSGSLHFDLEPNRIVAVDTDLPAFRLVPEKELAITIRRPGTMAPSSTVPPDTGRLGQRDMVSLLAAAGRCSDSDDSSDSDSDDSDDSDSDDNGDDNGDGDEKKAPREKEEATSIVPRAGAGAGTAVVPTTTPSSLSVASQQQKLMPRDIMAIVGYHSASRAQMSTVIRQWGQSMSSPTRENLVALDNMHEIASSINAKREAMERNATLLADRLAKALAVLKESFPDGSNPDVVAKRRALRAEYREAVQRQVGRLETVATKQATAWFSDSGVREPVTAAAASFLSGIREEHRRKMRTSTEALEGDEFNLFGDTASWFGEFMHKFADAGDDIMSRFNPVIFLVLESCNALSGHEIVYLLLMANISNAAYADFSVMAFNSVLTGIPGLGKSWVLNLFRNFLNIGARFVDSLTPKALQSWGNTGAGMLVHDDVSPMTLGIFPVGGKGKGAGSAVPGEREGILKTVLTQRCIVTETTSMKDGVRGVVRHEAINFMCFNMGTNATEAQLNSDAVQSRLAIMAWRPDRFPRVDGRAMSAVENSRPPPTPETKAFQALNALAICMGRQHHFGIYSEPTTIAFDVVVDSFMQTIDRLRIPLFQGRGGRGGRVRILQRMKRIALGSTTLRALMMSTMIKDTGLVSNTPFDMSHLLTAAKMMVVTERDAIQAFIGSGRYIISDSIVTLLIILMDLMKPTPAGPGGVPARPGGADGYMAINLLSSHALTDFVMISMPPMRQRSSWKTYLANTPMATRLGVTPETLGPALDALFDMEIPARSMTEEMKGAWDSVTPDLMKPTTSVVERATVTLLANGFVGPTPIDATKTKTVGAGTGGMPPPQTSFMNNILHGTVGGGDGGGGGRAHGGSASDLDGSGGTGGGRVARLKFGEIPDTKLEDIKTNKQQNTKAAWERAHEDAKGRKSPFLYIRREVFALANLPRVLQMIINRTPIANRVSGKITVPVSIPGSPAYPCCFEIPPPPPGCKQFYTLKNPVPAALGGNKAPAARKLFSKNPLLDALRGHTDKRKVVVEKMVIDSLAYRCRAAQMGYGPSAPYVKTAWKDYTPAEMATIESDTCQYLDSLRARGDVTGHPVTPTSYPAGFIPAALRREAVALGEAEMPGCFGTDWQSQLDHETTHFRTTAPLSHILSTHGDIGEDTEDEDDDDDGYDASCALQFGGGVGTTPFSTTPSSFGFKDVDVYTPSSTPTPTPTPETTTTRLQDVMFNPGVSTLPFVVPKPATPSSSKKRSRGGDDRGPGFPPGFTKRLATGAAESPVPPTMLIEEDED